MKKSTFIILFAILLSSCATLKKKEVKTTTTESTEIVTNSKDSSNVVTEAIKETKVVSQPIQKENYISLMTADSLTNIKINEALRNFRYYDRSGGNSVQASYDAETMQLLIQAVIAQTTNQSLEKTTDTKTDTNKELTSEKTFEQNVDEYISKVKIPWWIYAIGIFLMRNHILSILGFFIPGISNIKTINDLLGKSETTTKTT